MGGGNLGTTAALGSGITVDSADTLGRCSAPTGFALSGAAYDVSVIAFFLFQLVFMDTTATIPTGAMAERWRWKPFVVYGLFVSMILYPFYEAWTWGGGFLAQLGQVGLGVGYADFAGSGVVHSVGGWCALAGAIVLGPRIGTLRQRQGAAGFPATTRSWRCWARSSLPSAGSASTRARPLGPRATARCASASLPS